VRTYVERDVRQVLGTGDLAAFRVFTELCARRAGWRSRRQGRRLYREHLAKAAS
jgi:hypothetical protein